MFGIFRFPALTGLFFGASLLLCGPVAHAQLPVSVAAPAVHGYDFLTVTTTEGTKAFSLILFSPAFQGKTEIPLEVASGMVVGVEKLKELIHKNTALINEQLSALTVAGWELVHIYTPMSPASGRCYLFRKAKN